MRTQELNNIWSETQTTFESHGDNVAMFFFATCVAEMDYEVLVRPFLEKKAQVTGSFHLINALMSNWGDTLKPSFMLAVEISTAFWGKKQERFPLIELAKQATKLGFGGSIEELTKELKSLGLLFKQLPGLNSATSTFVVSRDMSYMVDSITAKF